MKFIILFLIILGGCSYFEEENWIGFYYANEKNLMVNSQSPMLQSYNQCIRWVNTQVEIYNPTGIGYDYECGKNCKFKNEYGLFVCEETIR